MAMKRHRGERKIKGVLAQPIEYDFDFLVVGAWKLEGELFEAVQKNLTSQLHTRFKALFQHFDISPSAPDAQFKLMMAMAIELFPNAFRVVRKGEKKKKKWTTEQQLNLLERMRRLVAEDPGMKNEDAAERIQKDKLLPEPVHDNLEPRSIVARYHEANRSMRRIRSGEAGPFEMLDFVASHKKLREDLRKSLQSGILAEIEKIQPGTVARLLELEPEELDEILRN